MTTIATRLFGRLEGHHGAKTYGVLGVYPEDQVFGHHGVALSMEGLRLLWQGHLNKRIHVRHLVEWGEKKFLVGAGRHCYAINLQKCQNTTYHETSLADDGGQCKLMLSAEAFYKMLVARNDHSTISADLLQEPHVLPSSFHGYFQIQAPHTLINLAVSN